jgi:hypothetical protein
MALPVLPGPLPGLLPGAEPSRVTPVTAYVAGSGAYAVSNATENEVPVPGTASLAIPVSNVTGDWMVAVITWRISPANPCPLFTVADDVRNFWDPLYAPLSAAPLPSQVAGSDIGVAIWAAPAARQVTTSDLGTPGNVYIAPTGFSPAWAAIIYDVSGLAPWVTTTAAVTQADARTVSEALPAPQSLAWVVTVSGWDNLTYTASQKDGGWGAVSTVTGSDGVDHATDIGCAACWQVTTMATASEWSIGSSGTVNWSAGIGSALVAAAAPAAPNTQWPAMWCEMAPAGGLAVPPDEFTWTAVTTAAMDLAITQGRQYETSQLSTGEGTLYLDNPLGGFIPPGTGSLAGLTSGTPVRLRCAWSGGSWQLKFYGDGTLAPQVSVVSTFTVTPGALYTTAAWLGSTSPWPDGLVLQITWQTSGGTQISVVSSAAVTGPQATLAAAAGYAPSNAAKAVVGIAVNGIPAANLGFYAAAPPHPAVPGYLNVPSAATWQASNGAVLTILAPWQGDPLGPPVIAPWYIPFNGFIERLPQQWDALYRGYTEATITDAWFGCNYNAQAIYPTEVLNDNPQQYWPCTDAQGSAFASNLAPGSSLPLAVTPSKYGTAGITQQFGGNPNTEMLGAESTLVISPEFRLTQGQGMWQLTGAQTGQSPVAEGYSLAAASSTYPPLGDGVTIEVWFQVNSPYSTYLSPYVLLLTDGNGPVLYVLLDGAFGTGHLILYQQGSNTPAVVSSVNYLTGTTSPLTQLVLTLNRSSWDAYINGQATVIGGAFSPRLPPSFTGVCLNGSMSSLYANFNGWTGQLSIYPYEMLVNRIQTHYRAGLTALAGELSQNRIERLLQAGFSTGRRAIGKQGGIYVTPCVSCQDIPQQPVSQSISNLAADLLPGMLFIAPTGDICHLSREAAWDQATRWVLGEYPWAGENQFEPDIGFDYDPTRLQNQIQLTQLDDQSITGPSVTAVETASQAQYGTVSNLATAYLQGDASYPLDFGPGLPDLADWLADVYATPTLRLSSVTVTADSDARRWPFVLGVSCGDLVQVNRRPLGPGTPLISLTGRVTQTERHFSYGKGGVAASVTCLIDSAPEAAALQLGSTTLGLLNSLNCLAW